MECSEYRIQVSATEDEQRNADSRAVFNSSAHTRRGGALLWTWVKKAEDEICPTTVSEISFLLHFGSEEPYEISMKLGKVTVEMDARALGYSLVLFQTI